MKRLITIVLAICMLMSMAAFAEAGAVLQDEQPPKVVTYVNAAGETIVAKICDAEGNVLAEIKDDGSMILTDVHARRDAENSIVVTRLTSAYEDVMGGVHYADVECKLHEHDVKVDIDTVLEAIDHEMDSHDLVMYELFDVMIPDEAAELLTDDNYLEVTFEIIQEHNGLPLITMFTGDGEEWMVLPTMAEGENRFTVQMPARGTIALLNDGRESMGIGQDVKRVVTVVPGTGDGETENTNFTPSVSGKSAPQIVPFEGEDGEVYIGYIRNNEGSVEIAVPDRNYIHVTAVAERDYIVDIQTHEHLEWSYDSILAVEDVGELFTEHDMSIVIPDHEHGTIAGLLDEALAEMGYSLTHDQLVVKDLFEVSAYGDYLHHLYDENYYLEIALDADLDPSKPLVVIHSPDSKHWHVHPIDEFAVNEDGAVTLKMYDLGAVAFLVEAEEELNPVTAVQSPN